jgi:hypothetical protein
MGDQQFAQLELPRSAYGDACRERTGPEQAIEQRSRPQHEPAGERSDRAQGEGYECPCQRRDERAS